MRRESPKVSGRLREYSRFGETVGGDGFDHDWRLGRQSISHNGTDVRPVETDTNHLLHLVPAIAATMLGQRDLLTKRRRKTAGLLTLSVQAGYHYPGLVILDMPAEFAGELIEDKENFIVQPFIELLDGEAFAETQMIITGASFAGLEGATRLHLTEVHVST